MYIFKKIYKYVTYNVDGSNEYLRLVYRDILLSHTDERS